MTPPTDTQIVKAAAPIVNGILADHYRLFFRTGMNPHTMDFIFKHKGDIRSAVDRAKKHCEIMNYRFVIVRPLFVDLDHEESRILNNA